MAVALVPNGDWGAAVLVSSMIASRILLAGVITVRSVIWSLNYARHQRARATSQLQMINAIMTVVISSAIGPLLDAYPESLAWIYWGGALVGSLGLLFFAQVRVVGEGRQRVRERLERKDPSNALGFSQILKEDRLFRWYQLNMFGAGFSNMLIEAPLIFIVTRQMDASYTASIMIIMVIPFAVSLVSMPVWAAYLDRVHVAQFRSRQSVLWIIAQMLTMVGAALESLALADHSSNNHGHSPGRWHAGLAAWTQRFCASGPTSRLYGCPRDVNRTARCNRAVFRHHALCRMVRDRVDAGVLGGNRGLGLWRRRCYQQPRRMGL